MGQQAMHHARALPLANMLRATTVLKLVGFAHEPHMVF